MRTVTPLLALLLLATALHAKPFTRTVHTLPQDLHEQTISLNKDYLVFSSEGLDETAKHPLVIFLHGGGGKGTNIAKKKSIPAIAPLIEEHIPESCFIVSPQCLPGGNADKKVWQAADLNVLLKHLKATLPVDEKRIYLTGFSMGGFGSWMWGGSNPEHFAAVVPGSGGIGEGGPKDITPDLELWAKNLATVPLWAFHGAKDPVVPLDRSEMMIDAIKKHGGTQAKLTVFPELGHNSKKQTYSDPELVRWMFRQAR